MKALGILSGSLLCALALGCTNVDNKNSNTFIGSTFSVTVPDDWQVVAREGDNVPAFITLETLDKSSTVTISTSFSEESIETLCQDSAKEYINEGDDIITGPEVSFGTCNINAQNGSKKGVWLRKYDDDNSVYKIEFKGDFDKITNLLSNTQGNEKYMSLFVRPI